PPARSRRQHPHDHADRRGLRGRRVAVRRRRLLPRHRPVNPPLRGKDLRMNRSLPGAFLPFLTVLAGAAHAASEAGAEGGSPLLRFNPGVGIWALVVFALLLLVLKKFAWTPILDALDARETAVRDSLEQATRIQAENARIQEEQARLLSEARLEAAQVIQNAREAGETLKKSLEASAQDEKRRILASAA